jgi:leucyl aminopeptidase
MALEVVIVVSPLQKLKDLKLSQDLPLNEDTLSQLKERHSKKSEKSVDFFESPDRAIVWLGDGAEVSTYELHRAAQNSINKYLKGSAQATVRLVLHRLPQRRVAFWAEALGVLSQTLLHQTPRWGLKSNEKREHIWHVDRSFRQPFESGVLQGRAMCGVAYLAELPGNLLRPDDYRSRVFEDLKNLRKESQGQIQFEFWDQSKLSSLSAGAFLSVIAAEPKSLGGVLKATYRPKKRSKFQLSLVGKGLCFDTGGYNLKTGTYMSGMHQDMIGSAVALESFKLLAREDYPGELHLWMALAENHISPTAFKCNDVVISASGRSIEVVDTDAEGRMVLADTLHFATKDKPDFVVDFATLTGASIRALDTRRSALFSNRPEWLEKVRKIGDRIGERVWPFPIDSDDFESLKSEVADVKQCADHNNCDHIFAAAFLSQFVNEIPWVHVDLSASKNKGGLGLMPHAATGFGVRLARALAWELVS